MVNNSEIFLHLNSGKMKEPPASRDKPASAKIRTWAGPCVIDDRKNGGKDMQSVFGPRI